MLFTREGRDLVCPFRAGGRRRIKTKHWESLTARSPGIKRRREAGGAPGAVMGQATVTDVRRAHAGLSQAKQDQRSGWSRDVYNLKRLRAGFSGRVLQSLKRADVRAYIADASGKASRMPR